MRESMPIALFLRNRLNYALNMKEVSSIMKQRLVKIDGKVRTDARFPAGFMDVVQLAKTNENFRLIYDVKGRFCVHRITAEEAKYKLCRVTRVGVGPKGVPLLSTNDGRTIRYPDPLVKVNDSIRVDISTNKTWTSSSSSPETSAWSPEVTTPVVSASLPTGSVIRDPSTLSTSRTLLATLSPLVLATSLSSARELSRTCHCPRATVSACLSQKRGTSVWPQRSRFIRVEHSRHFINRRRRAFP